MDRKELASLIDQANKRGWAIYVGIYRSKIIVECGRCAYALIMKELIPAQIAETIENHRCSGP